MELFDWLLGKKPKDTDLSGIPRTTQKVKFTYLILEADEKIPINKWYQKETWKNKSFVGYKENWGSDWKYASELLGESNVKISGLSYGSRVKDFLEIAQLIDFKIYFEDEPTNPVNKNARKIMVSGTVDGELVKKHVSVHRAPHLLCCRALEVQGVRLRTRTPRICSTL